MNSARSIWHEKWPALSMSTAALVALVSTFFAGKLQTVAGPIGVDKVSALQTLLVSIGGSLVGATAIVSTMVFYALQIHVERMPHNLFRKLSFEG